MMADVVLAGVAWITVPYEAMMKVSVHFNELGALVLLTVGNVVTPVQIGPEAAAGLLGAYGAFMPPVASDLPETGTG